MKYIAHVDTCPCRRPCAHKSHIIMQCVKAEKTRAQCAPTLVHVVATVKFTKIGLVIASQVLS